MTDTEEKALMLVASIKYFKGKTSQWLSENVDWLKNYSIFGIDRWLHYAEQQGYVRSVEKDKELIYYSTAKGIKKYNENFGQ
jgi:hypothetical protein